MEAEKKVGIKLFEGEALPDPFDDGKQHANLPDEDINRKYVRGDVRIVTEQARYPLNTVADLVASDNYKLNPEFQRRHRWDRRKQSRLIESLIMNVPIPPIFLYEDEYSHYEVMDGLQRLTAISEFYMDKFVLEDLDEWPELNGRTYSTLPGQVKRGIDRRYLSSIILLHETAKNDTEAVRLKQLVFERLNSGGIKLEYQETRNAIYNGPLNRLCIKLARDSNLCRMWGIPVPETDQENIPSDELLQNESYRKMDDVELVLRFFAYRQRLKYQRGALKDYLDFYLKRGNLFPEVVLHELADLFTRTTHLVHTVFGKKAFWLYRQRGGNWSWYGRPTTVVYDPMMFVFSQHLEDSERLISNKEQLKSGLENFYRSYYSLFEGRYTNLSNIVERNGLLTQFVESHLE